MEINPTTLSPSDRQLVAAWEDLFRSPGWKLVRQRYGQLIEGTISELESAESMKDLGLAQGSRNVLRDILSLEESIEGTYRSQIADAQADRQDVIEPEWRG